MTIIDSIWMLHDRLRAPRSAAQICSMMIGHIFTPHRDLHIYILQICIPMYIVPHRIDKLTVSRASQEACQNGNYALAWAILKILVAAQLLGPQ